MYYLQNSAVKKVKIIDGCILDIKYFFAIVTEKLQNRNNPNGGSGAAAAAGWLLKLPLPGLKSLAFCFEGVRSLVPPCVRF